jgi:phospholipid/cholesterol/gamma-HCH transport system permease protein
VNRMTDVQRGQSELRCSRPTSDMLRIELAGHWRLQDEFPALTDVEQALEGPPHVQRLTFDTTGLTGWDSGLVTFLPDLMALGTPRQLVVDQAGLPDGLRRLVHLATAVPERQGARREERPEPFLSRVGKASIDLVAAPRPCPLSP